MNDFKSLYKNRPLWWWIATWGGCGLSPIVSGTVGSLGALPFAYIIQITLGNVGLFAASWVMFGVGVWASNQYLKHNPGKEDPGEIVADEVAGQWLLLSILFPTWTSYLFAFVLFRLFDIIKPWPVSLADSKVPGGLGVMLDDMVAAAYPIVIYLLLLIVAQTYGSHNLLHPLINFLGGSYVH